MKTYFKYIFVYSIILYSTSCEGQSNLINTWQVKNDKFIQITQRYYNSKLIKSDTIAFIKQDSIFKYNNLDIFFNLNVPIDQNCKNIIDKNIDKKKLPEIKYSIILSLIISKNGELLDISIVSGNNIDSDIEVINAVKKSHFWKPILYKGEKVNYLTYFKYIHIFE